MAVASIKTCEECGANVYPEHISKQIAGLHDGKLLCPICYQEKRRAESGEADGKNGGGSGDDEFAPVSLADDDGSTATSQRSSKIRMSGGGSAIGSSLGATVDDSQCGFRVYPLEATQLRCRARHFGWEAEIITRAAWAGYRIINVPVRCRYFPQEQRVSHLNPLRETVRGIRLHMRLILTRLLFPARLRRGTAAPRSAHRVAPAADCR